MNKEHLDKLEQEATRGRLAKIAYDNFIGSFMSEKREYLFEVFQDIDITASDLLQETKRQLLVLNSLDQEIKSIIDTGKMAGQQLAMEPIEKH